MRSHSFCLALLVGTTLANPGARYDSSAEASAAQSLAEQPYLGVGDEAIPSTPFTGEESFSNGVPLNDFGSVGMTWEDGNSFDQDSSAAAAEDDSFEDRFLRRAFKKRAVSSTSSQAATTSTNTKTKFLTLARGGRWIDQSFPQTLATCASRYAGSHTTISGTGTLPRPTTWVKRSGQQLTLNGKNFRMVGPNIYWLCNDENVGTKGYPTDKGRIREALAIAVAMGANSIRLTTCGVSVGSRYLLEPTRGRFDSSAWDIHDYAIFAAGRYGLRVVLPLVDKFMLTNGGPLYISYAYYHGGKYTFLKWFGVSESNFGANFYTNKRVVDEFRNYVTTVMSRYNPYTKKAYKDDPTIMAWETDHIDHCPLFSLSAGNELGGYIGNDGYPPYGWTNSIAGLIKSLCPKSLVIDGTDGIYNYSTKAVAPGGGSKYVDIITDHAYPRSYALIKSEIPIAKKYNKNLLIGEFDWTGNKGGDDLAGYLKNVLSQYTMGLMVWSVFGHDARCCNYVTHNDGYSIYYPNGNSAADQARVLAVSQFFYRATGRSVPRTLVGVACPQPVF
ncbi:BZ3500_MvSof-1268-A1-R1_Chr3-2g06336 [Microbotryum saponariae]|uniref:mannan endo-1,4-beta-mannosidase n=1 Tax=Microbotryum saponariae TaxID=289078 RepID=A0A2X0KZ68_9BASI|nr:BZ3500_MvSof-1268-A1-R1_Chr3-2g06336 [Microbotryum saponariae]SDA04307.1 BZ3501_MvSof-1269-A2-R1_Chr3-2g06027 [Microbotryum saponariae]